MQKNQGIAKKKVRIVWKGFILRLVFLLLLVAVSYGGFILYKVYRLQQKIIVMTPTSQTEGDQKGFLETAKNLLGTQKVELRGEKDGRINILLLGMGGEGHKGKYLTDTIMLVSVEPVSYKSAMLSIPRDLYVEISDTKIYTKINAVYTYQLKIENDQGEAFAAMEETVENVTGQPIDYYIALDFDGFKNIIDEIGGIEVEVENDIYDPLYPGPNYSYEPFEIKKGFHHLDAETALKYSRVRHTQGGDFGRAARQQQVLAATKRKALSLGTIMNPGKLSNLIDTLGDHIKTDIQIAEIPSFIHLANNINIYQTTNKVLDAWSKDSLLASTHVTLGGVQAYVLMPRAKNYSQIHELSENIFDLGALEKKAKLIEEEQAKIEIAIDRKTNAYKIKNIMKKMGYDTSISASESFSEICSSSDVIISHSQETKAFTLDDLAKKLEMQVTYKQDPKADADITLCFSENLVTYFENQQEEERKEQFEQSSVMDENGDILINRK